MFSSRWATDDVPGIGSMTGERCSSQASASWDGGAVWSLGDLRRAGRRGERGSPVASGNQGMNAMSFCSAVLEHLLGVAVGEVVEVLHGDDRGGLRGFLDLVDDDLGQADVADLALLLERGELAELVGERDLRVDAVQLEQVDALEAEVAQAQLDLLAQVLGPADRAASRPARCG